MKYILRNIMPCIIIVMVVIIIIGFCLQKKTNRVKLDQIRQEI